MPTTAPVQVPRTKADAQRVLREFGYRGLKIESIEDAMIDPRTGKCTARIYALTGQILQEDGEMRRKAVTMVFEFTADEVRVRPEDGWVVA